MTRRPPSSTRTVTHFPSTPRVRSLRVAGARGSRGRAAGGDGRARRDVDAARSRWRAKGAGGRVLLVLPRDRAWGGRGARVGRRSSLRSEEHTSELQSLMRISYAVFCLKKKNP